MNFDEWLSRLRKTRYKRVITNRPAARKDAKPRTGVIKLDDTHVELSAASQAWLRSQMQSTRFDTSEDSDTTKKVLTKKIHTLN